MNNGYLKDWCKERTSFFVCLFVFAAFFFFFPNSELPKKSQGWKGSGIP